MEEYDLKAFYNGNALKAYSNAFFHGYELMNADWRNGILRNLQSVYSVFSELLNNSSSDEKIQVLSKFIKEINPNMHNLYLHINYQLAKNYLKESIKLLDAKNF